MIARRRLDNTRWPAAGGHTLVEVVVSLGVFSIVLGAIGSAVVIASRAMPETDDPADDTTLAASIAADIAAELQLALAFNTRTPEIVLFAVADRDADTNEELIRYAWSGTPGDPLTRRYNAGTTVDILKNVQEFELTYETDTVMEETGVEVSAEEMLVGVVTETDCRSMPMQAASSGGQFLQPSLPADAITWTVTRVLVQAEQSGDAVGELLAQLRPMDVTGHPAPAVLEAVPVPESDLPATYNWHEITFDTVTEWPAVQPLNLVFLSSAGAAAGRFKYSQENGWGRLWTIDGAVATDDKTIQIDAAPPPPPPAENYRSIGTDTGTLYSTGNASVAFKSNIVTFAGGASLPTNVGQGDELVIGGFEVLYIYSRDSDTQVTVQGSAAATHVSEAYTIKRAYNTMQAWEDGRDGDLVADDRREVGVCYNDGPFTSGVIIDGSTTDATHYMMLTVAEGQRHNGMAGTGARIDLVGGVGADAITIDDEYFRVEWLEITNWFDSMSGVSFTGPGLSDHSSATRLLLHSFDSGGNEAAVEVEAINTIRNTIIYDGSGNGIRLKGGSSATVENCTIYGITGDGVKQSLGNIAIRNTISVGNSDDDFELNDTIDNFGYNMYSTTHAFDPNTCQGNNQAPPANLDDLFVSIIPGSEDLHLEDSGHNAIDTGLDLPGVVTIDIDGEPRSTPWDLGADEVSGTALTISSGRNQTFTMGDPATAISAITIQDAKVQPVITAADDIRIRIPAGFNMTWNNVDTVAMIKGTAAGKVSSNVSYEDANKTLVVDVTSDFAAQDTIVISDLSFKNFSNASGADILELDVDNDAGGGATWTLEPTESLYYSVYGTYTTPTTEARTYLTGVRVKLRTSSDPAAGVETATALLQRVGVTP
jgi:hypothetical protein